MSNMDVSQSIHDHDRREPCPKRPDPVSAQSPIAIATRRLYVALRIWDEDQAQAKSQAKSQIKVAVALLQSGTGEPPMQERPPGRVAHRLVPWQAQKVREFIDHGRTKRRFEYS
jgi:hypothetical protein